MNDNTATNGAATRHDDQTARWNGAAGQAWVDGQAMLDQLFEPLQDLLIEPIPAGAGAEDGSGDGGRYSLLDIGCGTGGTTRAAAGRIATPATGDDTCIGIDISVPMIEAARRHARQARLPVRFVLGDAQTHDLGTGRFDLIMSRFGVMFFADPVTAFRNMRGAARQGGQLRFVAWRSAADNPFMTTAETAAAPLLPDLPHRRTALPGQANLPGQFAFADPDRVRRILDDSGWTEIALEAVDVVCSMPLSALTGYISRLGPVGLALTQTDNATRTRIVEAIRPAFDPFVSGDMVRFTAACWLATAAAPGR